MTARRNVKRVATLITAVATATALWGAVSSAVGEEQHGPRRHMVVLTNQARAEHDRAALEFAGRLSRYAKEHSRAMAQAGYLFHSSADELRGALAGYRWQLGGENIGVGASLESLQDAFMASDPHRENLLNSVYDHQAVGIWHQDGRIWITVIFYG